MANPFAHIELSTDNLGNAKKFYKKIFDWKLEDMKGMPYTMIGVGTGPGGGMQPKQMPEQPSAWMPYVQVDNVKKTMAKAAKNGATVILEFQEIGEMGAIGIFADPSGAALGLWEEKKKVAKKAAKKAAKPAKKAAKKK